MLIVLGFGPPAPCADELARQVLESMSTGVEPLDALAAFLDRARRIRWPGSAGTFSASVRGSNGQFGAVVAAPAVTFSPDGLVSAVERHRVMDGRHSAWASRRARTRATEQQASEDGSPCDATAASSLQGSLGVLFRTQQGDFLGGMVSLDDATDAGVLSALAHYGVSVAVDELGAVLLISDCVTPPLDDIAERVYANPDWAAATGHAERRDDCRTAHAWLTPERTQVTSASPVVWAAVEQTNSPIPALLPSAAGSRDAGSPGAAGQQGSEQR